jgi:ATP-dependent DNA helicase RecG
VRSELASLIEKGESELLAFKGARASLESIAKTVCAMLNQQGGVLLWGMDDQGKIVGLENAPAQAHSLNGYLIDNLSPLPLLSVFVTEDESVVRVDIPAGADKPYSLKREIWVRVGNRTLRASEEDSVEIVEKSAAQLDRWERSPMPGFSMEDCDSSELARARSEIAKGDRFGADLPNTDEELLRRLFMLRSGQLTNAAVVLFARLPRTWAPNLAVRIVFYQHDKTGPIANDTILEGPAIRVLREAVEIIQQRTGYSLEFNRNKLEREERPAYTVFALREGLVNAMVHRAYESIGGDVRIEVFPDYLNIRNHGTLPKGWSTANLFKEHNSQPRNPDIARVFFLRRLMEQLGIGTRKVIEECKKIGAKPPIWTAESNTVTLKLFRSPEPKVTDQLASRQIQFLKDKDVGTEFKVADYAAAVEISERQARRDLADLESLGLVERIGKGPSTSYRRTEKSL